MDQVVERLGDGADESTAAQNEGAEESTDPMVVSHRRDSDADRRSAALVENLNRQLQVIIPPAEVSSAEQIAARNARQDQIDAAHREAGIH